MDYCNGIESPPAYLFSFDKNLIPQFDVNIMYTPKLVHPYSTNQTELVNIIAEIESSSSVHNNGKELNIDTVQINMAFYYIYQTMIDNS